MSTSSTEASTQAFNPYTPEFRANPYPFYHEQRVRNPVHWRGKLSSGVNSWDVTGYEEAVAVLNDDRLGREVWKVVPPEQLARIPEALQPLFQMFRNWLPMYDPPEHTRLQGVLRRKFTRQYIESLYPYIERIVNDVLDEVSSADTIDFVADFARQIPIAVMAKILGVPIDMRPQLNEWSAEILRAIEFEPRFPDLLQGTQAVAGMYEYFKTQVEERRRQPTDDLISVLVEAKEQGDILNEDEILANCVLMVMAGGESTASLIGTGMLALLRNPDQLEKLRTDPTLYHSACEELIRYEPPAHVTHRIAFEDVEIAGQTIRRGERVNVWMGAINRDPAKFPDPDRLDLSRDPNPHLGFGHGVHACLGYFLAHAELEITFKTLLKRVSHFELQTEQPEWQETIMVRALKSLPISFSTK